MSSSKATKKEKIEVAPTMLGLSRVFYAAYRQKDHQTFRSDYRAAKSLANSPTASPAAKEALAELKAVDEMDQMIGADFIDLPWEERVAIQAGILAVINKFYNMPEIDLEVTE
jgi:hypothetical protein